MLIGEGVLSAKMKSKMMFWMLNPPPWCVPMLGLNACDDYLMNLLAVSKRSPQKLQRRRPSTGFNFAEDLEGVIFDDCFNHADNLSFSNMYPNLASPPSMLCDSAHHTD